MTADRPAPPPSPSAASDDPEGLAIRRKFDLEFWRTMWLQLGGMVVLFAAFTGFNIAFP
jgi:hypothetical protein